jgi:putative DNA primase/helicase
MDADTIKITSQQVLLDNLPRELTSRSQWVCWRLERRPGEKKLTKPPYNIATQRHADTGNSATWATFNEVVQVKGSYDGVGYVLVSADHLTFIDLDNCRNPETGEIAKWAWKVV